MMPPATAPVRTLAGNPDLLDLAAGWYEIARLHEALAHECEGERAAHEAWLAETWAEYADEAASLALVKREAAHR